MTSIPRKAVARMEHARHYDGDSFEIDDEIEPMIEDEVPERHEAGPINISPHNKQPYKPPVLRLVPNRKYQPDEIEDEETIPEHVPQHIDPTKKPTETEE